MNLTKSFRAFFETVRDKAVSPMPSAFWTVGDELHTRLTVTRGQITRGEQITVTFPNGEFLEVILPPMLKSGCAIRLQMEPMTGSNGFLYLNFEVDEERE